MPTNLIDRAFVDGYTRTALWSSTDDDGDPLDDQYELADSTKRAFERDCANFAALIVSEGIDTSAYDPGRIGHDFWLTRNGHGAGFWDGDYPRELGEALTKCAKSMGSADLYIGTDDDGKDKVYQLGDE